MVVSNANCFLLVYSLALTLALVVAASVALGTRGSGGRRAAALIRAQSTSDLTAFTPPGMETTKGVFYN
jgi:hypothetical protein